MITGKIEQANERLKKANVRVRIQMLGSKLYLQATLPPKAGSPDSRSKQQRITLGLSANPATVALAEKEARKVGALLDLNQFDWRPYLSTKQQPPTTIGDWVERFKQEYQSKVSAITWQTDYADPFRRLDLSKPLSYAVLETVILQSQPNTRQRKRLCQAYSKLAILAGLERDFKLLKGSYSARTVSPRNLPPDEAIAAFYQQLSNPGWKFIYGMIATYGLRPHEAFFLDLENYSGAEITVLEGKTENRQVWPLYPEWVEGFNLTKPVLPDVTGRQHSDFGDRVTCYLRRAGMPWKPYDLRHTWAVRSLLFGVPDAIAAAQMGHSLVVHNETYQHWITARDHQQVHQTVVNRSDRPVAPTLQGPIEEQF